MQSPSNKENRLQESSSLSGKLKKLEEEIIDDASQYELKKIQEIEFQICDFLCDDSPLPDEIKNILDKDIYKGIPHERLGNVLVNVQDHLGMLRILSGNDFNEMVVSPNCNNLQDEQGEHSLVHLACSTALPNSLDIDDTDNNELRPVFS